MLGFLKLLILSAPKMIFVTFSPNNTKYTETYLIPETNLTLRVFKDYSQRF